MRERCDVTEVMTGWNGKRMFYRCDREAGHTNEHHAYGDSNSELLWPNAEAPTPGVGWNVLLWIAGGLLFWVIVIAIAVVLTR